MAPHQIDALPVTRESEVSGKSEDRQIRRPRARGCNQIARTHWHGRHPGAGRDPWYRSTTGSGQARSSKPGLESETCSTVDPGLRRDDVASIYARYTPI